MSEEFLKIIEILKEKQISSVGIFTHHNADPDAFASAIALKTLLHNYFPHLEITLFSSSISSLTNNLYALTEEKFKNEIDQNDLEAIFICDTNNLIQIGNIPLEEYVISETPFFIIDHHSYHEFTDKVVLAIVKQVSSTAEILTEIFSELNINIEKNIATMLLAGILYDSRRFRYISNATFSLVQYLINKGGDYEKALSILHSPMSVSEKMARIKGVTRAKVSKINSDICTVSYVGSFESSVARSLIVLGSDIAAVIAKSSEDEVRISLRCSRDFANKNKINLGNLANKLSNKLGGSGGGHLTAAGINVVETKNLPTKKEDLIDMIFDLMLEEINQAKI